MEAPCVAISNKQKYHFFLLKNGGQNKSSLGGWYQRSGEDVGKGCRRVNMVQILHTYICKWKNEIC
jgi:hypothetical protein